MHQSRLVGFGQRTANLLEDIDDSGLGQSTVPSDQITQVDAVQIFHGIIENSIRGMTVIEDLNGIRMHQAASLLHFLLEPLDCLGVGLVRRQQLDGRIPAQQRMGSSVNGSHSPFADLFRQRVLPQFFHLPVGRFHPAAQRKTQPRKQKHPDAAQHGEQQQDEKDQVQGPEGFEGDNLFHLRSDAETVIGQPMPSAHHRHAPVISKSLDIDPVVPRHGFADQPGKRPRFRAGRRSMPPGQVAAGIAQFQKQGRSLIGLQPAGDAQFRFEPAAREHDSVAVESERFSRLSVVTYRKNPAEFLFRPDHQSDDSDDLSFHRTYRSGHGHDGSAPPFPSRGPESPAPRSRA